MERTREGEPIRVLLADDHTMFRQGLAEVLASYGGMKVVGQTDNDEQAVELARRTRPDVVLMQIQVPLERAKENLRRIRQAVTPPPKVIVVTMLEDPRYVSDLVNLGVSAYVLKSASANHLIAAVRAAILDPKSENVVVGLPKTMLQEAEEGTGGVLSARELEILLLAARGLSNRQIGTFLHLAEATVKRHLANIYRKMEVGSRSEATREALAERWITIRDVTETGGESGPPSF